MNGAYLDRELVADACERYIAHSMKHRNEFLQELIEKERNKFFNRVFRNRLGNLSDGQVKTKILQHGSFATKLELQLMLPDIDAARLLNLACATTEDKIFVDSETFAIIQPFIRKPEND